MEIKINNNYYMSQVVKFIIIIFNFIVSYLYLIMISFFINIEYQLINEKEKKLYFK